MAECEGLALVTFARYKIGKIVKGASKVWDNIRGNHGEIEVDNRNIQ